MSITKDESRLQDDLSFLQVNFARQMRCDIPVAEKVDAAIGQTRNVEKAAWAFASANEGAKKVAPVLQDFYAQLPKDDAFIPARVEISRVATGLGIALR